MEKALCVGQWLGRFRLIRSIGEGGMGEVHLAFDPQLDRLVAIKLAHRDAARPLRTAALDARLRREAVAMARLAHPNIIAVYEIGESDGRTFVVMELAERNLAQELELRGSWRNCLRLFVEAGLGLCAAHHANLVHRDFKPENVLVDGNGHARVSDFGLSSASTDASIPTADTGVHGGTLRYMAPEHHLGEPIGEAADQFGFCVALYEALFGRHPFSDDGYRELVTAVVNGAWLPPARGEVPAAVVDAICRGLKVDPRARHESMAALLLALSAAAQA